ncbi:hypothetical protein [Robertmurraya sp.]|uniref:hypothetical protein n=1 Tax=Robertmurraya sp. TaxID=2837525 RepID=UPI00370444CE
MKTKVITIFLAILLVISGYINYSYLTKDKQEIENLFAKYTSHITYTESLESGLKGDSPFYYYLELIGKNLAIGELIQRHPNYRENEFAKIYTDVPIDMRLLFARAYESQNRENELRRLHEIHQIVAKHLNKDVVRDPRQYHYAYVNAQSEIREKKLLDEQIMGGLLGW